MYYEEDLTTETIKVKVAMRNIVLVSDLLIVSDHCSALHSLVGRVIITCSCVYTFESVDMFICPDW